MKTNLIFMMRHSSIPTWTQSQNSAGATEAPSFKDIFPWNMKHEHDHKDHPNPQE